MSKKVAVPLGWASEAPSPQVRLTRDTGEITGLLDARRAYAATVYGYLEPPHFQYSRWYVAEGGEEPALLMQVDSLIGPSLFAQGDTQGLEAILDQATPLRHAYITYEARHKQLIGQRYVLRAVQPLARMTVAASGFCPVPSEAVPLEPAHLPQINDLYRTDSGALLSRKHLMEGLYYGIWRGNRLVSVAGTQLLSPQHDIAVVANVLTHPQHRDKGYATRCVSGLTAALLNQVHDVVLNVDPENTPALHVYQRLGYIEAERLAEAWAIWRGRTVLDRMLATFLEWFSH